MKKIMLMTALAIGLSAFGTAQAQDTTRRQQNKNSTMKKGKAQKKMKKNNRRTADSTGTYGTGTMNNQRRDSL